MERGAKKGLKPLICPKNARRYRYRLVRYRYRFPSASFCTSGTGTGQSGTGTTVPIGNSGVDVKYIIFECLQSRISLHAHFSPCSYSAQTDYVHGVDNCTSFF